MTTEPGYRLNEKFLANVHGHMFSFCYSPEVAAAYISGVIDTVFHAEGFNAVNAFCARVLDTMATNSCESCTIPECCAPLPSCGFHYTNLHGAMEKAKSRLREYPDWCRRFNAPDFLCQTIEGEAE